MKYPIIGLLVGSLLLQGCGEDIVCEDTCEILNDVTDLIGFMDPNDAQDETGTLYVNETYLADVLTAFAAVPAGNGLYTTNIQTVEGEVIPFRFTTIPTSTPFLFVTSDNVEEVLSKYKVYKDAECKTLDGPAPAGECLPIDDEYYTYEFLGWDVCKKGSGICTEIYKVYAIKRIYEDSNCMILTRVETNKAYDC